MMGIVKSKVANVQATIAKLGTWDCVKLRSFCFAKETTSRVKRHPTEQEKIFTSCVSGRRLIYRTYQQLRRCSNKRKQPIKLRSEQGIWISSFWKKKFKWHTSMWENAQHHVLWGKCKAHTHHTHWDITSPQLEWLHSSNGWIQKECYICTRE